jgi:hypothetical protein
MKSLWRVLFGVGRLIPAWLFLQGSLAPAAGPEFHAIDPPGGQRGTEIEATLYGARIDRPAELMIYEPGITVTKLTPVDKTPGQVKATLKIAPDAALGEYHLRLRTVDGVAHLRTFHVGQFPTVQEKEPNSLFTEPQKVAMNTTVHGKVTYEDIDYFVVEAKKGQRISVEVEAIRLGGALFDAAISILDANRFELATADDTPLLAQDCHASAIAPADGLYTVAIRESSFAGAEDYRYRLHIGDFPRPAVVFPFAGQAGQSTEFTFLGDLTGPIRQTILLPEPSARRFGVFAEQNGVSSPSFNPIRVSKQAQAMEQEPNENAQQATAAPGPLPLSFNGVIQQPNDHDHFRFKASKGQQLNIHVHARSMGSPLDPVLLIQNSAGNGLASNDDEGGRADSHLRFSVPEDGEYVAVVFDQLKRGGETFVYRLTITPATPSVNAIIPEVGRDDSQTRQWVAVPRGNRWMTLLQLNRSEFGGPLEVWCDDLPAGVKMTAPQVRDSVGHIPVVFEAAPDAPIAGKLVDLQVRHADVKQNIAGRFVHTLGMVRGNPNNTPYYSTTVDRLAVAVVEESPFAIRIVAPKVPLLQAGSMNLKIVAEKRSGWDEEIHVQLPFRPPGVNAQYEIVIPKGQTEANYPVNANGDARTGEWDLAAAAWANVGGGQLWVGSPMLKLTIAPLLVTGQIQMAVTEQGKPTVVLVKLQHPNPFEGTAKLDLVGLPHKVAAAPVEINKDTPEASFQVTTDPTSPEGQHATLFCQFTQVRDGEPMVQTFAGGGVLRIDKPKPAAPALAPTAAAATSQPAAPAPPASAKPLSRLEMLRLERQQNQGK